MVENDLLYFLLSLYLDEIGFLKSSNISSLVDESRHSDNLINSILSYIGNDRSQNRLLKLLNDVHGMHLVNLLKLTPPSPLISTDLTNSKDILHGFVRIL